MKRSRRTTKTKQPKPKRTTTPKAALESNGGFETEFHAWLQRVCKKEKPPSSIVAYNIGLFQTPDDGYSAYLIGAEEFSEDEDDWACEGDGTFTPKERYFPLPPKEFKGKEWQAVQNAVARTVKAFLTSPAAKSSFFRKAEAVTVGFDDGDLVRVK